MRQIFIKRGFIYGTLGHFKQIKELDDFRLQKQSLVLFRFQLEKKVFAWFALNSIYLIFENFGFQWN